MAKARVRMTEEALSAEASRYEPVTDVLGVGIGTSSLLLLFLGAIRLWWWGVLGVQ